MILALLALIIGSITDIQKREVHDYVSHILIFGAWGFAIIEAIINWDYIILITTGFGFILGMGLAYAMFYLGQWGGGDSKLMMGLGAVIGCNFLSIFGENNFWIIYYLLILLFVGAVYGLAWSIGLAIKNSANFMLHVRKYRDDKKLRIFRIAILLFALLACILIITFIPRQFQVLFIGLIAALYITFYLWIFVKIIEESCMIKALPTSKLTEGDWINQEIHHKGKYVTGPKDLGISKKQILLLKKYNIKSVIVKEGIPFIPAMLIAFIILVIVQYAKIALPIMF
jgi:Flp pilus assembly protein protease CpaA